MFIREENKVTLVARSSVQREDGSKHTVEYSFDIEKLAEDCKICYAPRSWYEKYGNPRAWQRRAKGGQIKPLPYSEMAERLGEVAIAEDIFVNPELCQSIAIKFDRDVEKCLTVLEAICIKFKQIYNERMMKEDN